MTSTGAPTPSSGVFRFGTAGGAPGGRSTTCNWKGQRKNWDALTRPVLEPGSNHPLVESTSEHISHEQDEITRVLANTPDDLKRILGPNERVELYIKQKIYHPKINVDSVILTNERIILRHPHALGLRKDYTDFNYRDISNAVLEKGVLRSTIKCTLRLGGEPLALGDIPNSEAEKAYGIIRQNSVASQNPQPAVAPVAIAASVTPQAGDSTAK